MQFSVKTLTLAILALGIPAVCAKPLTEKQTRDAAARIDSLLDAGLKAASLTPNGRIDDAIFLRRSYLGIIGRIPTEPEARSFFENNTPDKRALLIDSLTASPGFDSHLFNWTADLLRVQTKQEQFGLGWHVWLRKSLSEDKPWDVLVREMLASTGHSAKDPAVGYYLRDRNMQLDNFSNSMQVFLGRQIGCAQCHDHPFDDWSQYEYYQMAAFGGGTTYRSMDVSETIKRVVEDTGKPTIERTFTKDKKKNKLRNNEKQRQNRGIQKLLQPVFKDFNKNAIFDDSTQELKLPEDYQYRNAEPKSAVAPETLFGEHLENVPPTERKEAFAKWVTSPENPYFTKVIANRLWARTFGHGLLDPVDDWNEDSKPSHPEVLAFLEETMKAVDYDLRQFSRVLFQTKLFQRECDDTEPEPGTTHLVHGPALQRMTAEQIFDSLIVLNHGEISDSPLTSYSREWESYKASVGKLLEAESHDLLVLAEATTQAESTYRESQIKLRTLQRAVGEATPGDERKKAYEAVSKMQSQVRSLNKQRNPLAMDMNDSSMQMMGGGGKREKSGNRSAARASENPAPFNPATIVREFGGSDRTTPSSGDTVPTVPQALALLNDPNTDIIASKKSYLGKRLSSTKNPAESLEIIFLNFYSRLPTDAESERYTPLVKDAIGLRDLTRAMLTSNQFIFVR